IADGRIAAIRESGTAGVPPQAVTFDGRGKYLIPGLIDMHVHLFKLKTGSQPNDWAFGLFVANGVTGVREMNAKRSDMQTISAWRTALANGSLRAPRIVATGIGIYGDSEEAVRK